MYGLNPLAKAPTRRRWKRRRTQDAWRTTCVLNSSTCLAFSSVVALCGISGAGEFVVTDSDVGPAPIILFEGAPPRTRDAAVTLADYIAKSSGMRPELVDGQPQRLPERAIWVGVQPVVRTLFPQIDFDFQHPEETLIAASENHLVIAGRDRWDPAHMTAKGRLSIKTDMQQEYGTANAVYTFLQDQLGVRWLWPGEEDVVKQERISLSPCERRYHPQFRARGSLFQKLSLGDSREDAGELWSRFQRVQLDSMEIKGGHGFGGWWGKYGNEHPEHFAAAPDGGRRPIATNPHNTKLCASQPAVWRQWMTEVEQQLRENPTQRVFSVSPNDGYTTGHCVCDDCLAWDHPDGEKVVWGFGGGVKYEGVSQTDRDVRFANTLARMLKKRYPSRDLLVQLHAYGLARNPPIGIAPDDNVIISSVANFSMRSPEDRVLPMQQYDGWSKSAKHLMWRPNLGS